MAVMKHTWPTTNDFEAPPCWSLPHSDDMAGNRSRAEPNTLLKATLYRSYATKVIDGKEAYGEVGMRRH